MIVVGIDPSLTSTGIATIETYTRSGKVARVRSTGKADDTLFAKCIRVIRLGQELDAEIPGMTTLAVIEAPAFSMANAGTSQINGLWWAYACRLTGMGIPVVSVSPTTLKKYATGKGTAKKDEVLAAVCRRYPQVDITNNDEADAMVLAAMGARALGHPIEDDLPAKNLEAMASPKWKEAVK